MLTREAGALKGGSPLWIEIIIGCPAEDKNRGRGGASTTRQYPAFVLSGCFRSLFFHHSFPRHPRQGVLPEHRVGTGRDPSGFSIVTREIESRYPDRRILSVLTRNGRDRSLHACPLADRSRVSCIPISIVSICMGQNVADHDLARLRDNIMDLSCWNVVT